MFVAGGSGFVGSNVCKEAVRIGFKVVSLSRTGRPAHLKEPWVDEVEWVQGCIMDHPAWVAKMQDADAVVSCVGKFGYGTSNVVFETNADANIHLAHLASKECRNISKFAYISTQQYSPRVQWPFRAYFNSKAKAEVIIQALFPNQYLIMRPNWVFGWKHLFGPVWFPWQLLGNPMEHVMQPIASYASNTKCIVPPIHVEELAHVLALGCTVGKDVHGHVPTVRVRDIIEREAQNKPLDDWLRPYLHQLNSDKKKYIEETNFVEKYGVRAAGRMKSHELFIMRKREELNPATTRPEFAHPVKGPGYLFDQYVTPEYRKIEQHEREIFYLEGREKQKLFEAQWAQAALEGERRLLGDYVHNIPKYIEENQRDPAKPKEGAVYLEETATRSVTPSEEEWQKKQRDNPSRGSSYFQSIGGGGGFTR
eukprot:TRINITY_DN22119_c0_g1_i1.p1 TRINITY_DN22119_c0_g1~~TRINITY_DN22119_c0_g1_i1.p1  ORF type:complete len:456 (+),score=192.29 TRINITY_DN22119_c0_g1_i1:102-1370(+)